MRFLHSPRVLNDPDDGCLNYLELLACLHGIYSRETTWEQLNSNSQKPQIFDPSILDRLLLKRIHDGCIARRDGYVSRPVNLTHLTTIRMIIFIDPGRRHIPTILSMGRVLRRPSRYQSHVRCPWNVSQFARLLPPLTCHVLSRK